MNTITVENTNYKFEEIPGKGKCLVPIVQDAFSKAIILLNEGVNANLRNVNKKFKFTQGNYVLTIVRDCTRSVFGFIIEGEIEKFNSRNLAFFEVRQCGTGWAEYKDIEIFMRNNNIKVTEEV
jgi:hypothetical protein